MTGISSRRTAPLGVALAGLIALSACTDAGDYAAPSFPFLARYAAVQSTPVLLTNTAWWQRLGDPLLNRLVARALSQSTTLNAARERVAAARSARNSVPGSAVLSTDASGRIEGNNGSVTTAAPLQIGLEWILDPWGGRRSTLRAEDARIGIAEAERDAARLLLIYRMAGAYLDLRYAQTSLALAHQERAERRRTLALTRQLRTAGEATAIDVTRSEARLAQIAADLPTLSASIVAARNEIAVLAGAAPGTLPPDLSTALKASGTLPRPGLPPEIGIPADLLRNRPDIRIAERSYAVAVADIGTARAAAYPTLSLSGAITLDALGGGTDYFFGPRLQLPNLNPAITRAAIARRESAARAAFQDWRGTVLEAILEVENALANYSALTSSEAAAVNAVQLYARARNLTRELYERNEVNFGELLDLEENLVVSQRRLARLRRDRAAAFLELNTRIGAGHGVGPDPAGIAPTEPPKTPG